MDTEEKNEEKTAEVRLEIVTRAREPITESFSFRTTPEEAAKIKKVAEEEKITASDVVRSALHSTGII